MDKIYGDHICYRLWYTITDYILLVHAPTEIQIVIL